MNNLKNRLDNYVGDAPRLTDALENKIIRKISAMEKKNQKKTMFSKVRISVLFAVVLTVATVFILSVVIPSESINPIDSGNGTDPNETAITKVLELQFNGVDEKMNELLDDPKNRIVIDGKEEIPEFDQYIEETYGPYFTKEGLGDFIIVYGTHFQVLAYSFGYQLDLQDVTIEQHETIPNRYTFTAKVGYQKDGSEEQTAEVKGTILFSTKEKGKIGKFQYEDDGGLTDILNESI